MSVEEIALKEKKDARICEFVIYQYEVEREIGKIAEKYNENDAEDIRVLQALRDAMIRIGRLSLSTVHGRGCGHWNPSLSGGYWQCSECAAAESSKTNFCHRCGSFMGENE